MSKRISVVVSQSPGKNPVKRKLEEDIVTALLFEDGIDVTVVPNLYDIAPESTAMVALSSLSGNIVLCSWLFERAAHWVLDRSGIAGHVGETLITSEDDEGEDDDESTDDGEAKSVVNDRREKPNRKIYCLDLKSSSRAEDFIAEAKRIRDENAVQVVTLGDIVSGSSPMAIATAATDGDNGAAPVVNRIDETAGRRWYPVIDYNRCTNCMECIDFCLFGVYGVDRIDTILVEEPDNCRKGCPACSRVCPENAIMFPQHKTPAIAGSNDATASLKIDLSQLFGAPASGKSADEIAAMERDEQLLLAGREAVGVLPKRHETAASTASEPAKDAMDDLVDQLNELDL